MQEKWINTKCPICSGSGKVIFKEVHYDQTFKLEKCDECSMLYINPRIQNIEKAGYQDSVSDYVEKHLGEYKTKVFNEILDHMDPFRSNFTELLDVGSGIGYFLYLVSKRGYKTTGLELSPVMIDYAKEKYGIKLLSVDLRDKILLKSNSFDIVTSLDVFEHLLDPADVLKEIYRVLKPGGLIVLRYPNGLQTLLKCRLVAGLYKKNRRAMLCAGAGGHINFWDKKTTYKFLLENGFEILDLWVPKPEKYHTSLVNILKIVYGMAAKILYAVSGIHIGNSINVIARKKAE